MKMGKRLVALNLKISFSHFVRLCKSLRFKIPNYFSYEDLKELSKLIKYKDTYRSNCLSVKVHTLMERF